MRWLVPVALLAAAVTGAPSAVGLTSAYPSGGSLAFTYGGDLYTIRSDGSHVRLRTVDAHDPRWSPDGRTIAYSSGNSVDGWAIRLFAVGRGGFSGYVTQPAGRHGNGLGDSQPAWLPDGKRLLFLRNVLSANADGIWSIDVARHRRVRVAAPRDGLGIGQAQAALDGQEFVFYDASGQLWAARTDGTGRHAIAAPDTALLQGAWSPDGTKLAFIDGSDGTLKIRDTRAHRTSAVAFPGDPVSVAWSPTGRWLAVGAAGTYPCNDPTSDNACAAADIWIVNAADGRYRRIYRHRADDEDVTAIDWSPTAK